MVTGHYTIMYRKSDLMIYARLLTAFERYSERSDG
jgi:hypothetical protein